MATPDHSVQAIASPSAPAGETASIPLPGPKFTAFACVRPCLAAAYRRLPADRRGPALRLPGRVVRRAQSVISGCTWPAADCWRRAVTSSASIRSPTPPGTCTGPTTPGCSICCCSCCIRNFGGALLVVLKALLIVVLAALLLSVRRPGSRLGLPVLCTLLAVLAMSPRLLLHSTCLSYVFLGLTLWLLWRSPAGPSTPRQDLKRYAPLLLLFVLWVNVDSWFLLGPLLAALFWLGERLLPERGDCDGGRRTPAWLCLAGLAVCLVNPHTWHAFTLPVDLAPLPNELRHDPRFERLFASPWHMSFFYHPVAGLNLGRPALLLRSWFWGCCPSC